MPTLEERVAALEAQTPRRSYTSMWSGEEIDRRLLNAAGRNLLDNSWWARKEAIVNQRGQLEYTGGYGIDRWESANCTILILDRGVKIISNLGKRAYWSQIMEGYWLLEHQVTCSVFCADGTLFTWTIYLKTPNPFPTSKAQIYSNHSGRISLEVWITPSNQSISFQFNTRENVTEVILALKLEPGPISTLCRKDAAGNWVLNDPPPDYGLELAKCQRYQLVLMGSQFNQFVGIGYCYAVGELLAFFPTPVTLRSIPTIVMGTIRFVGVTGGMQVFTITPSMIRSVTHESNGITGTFDVPSINAGIGWLDVSNIILDANL